MTDLMRTHLETIVRWKYSKDNEWGYKTGDLPFIDYLLEDKSNYKPLNDAYDPIHEVAWIDKDGDFLLGESGGVLMKMDFVFIGTSVFSKVADFYERNGCYTLEPEDTPAYDEFWRREKQRRIRGVSAKCKLYYKDIEKYLSAKTDAERKALLHPVRITGDHYNYLNYGRIERKPNEQERKKLDAEGKFKVNTVEGFPRFWDGDYWNFKIDELIAYNKYNLAKAKARRKGFSYKRGSQAANTLNLYKNVTVALVADQMGYLTDKGATSYMTKTNLDWFENNTNWARGYLSEDYKKGIELGYKLSSEGNKSYGHRSRLLSIPIGMNESAGVGAKAIEMDFEEAGKCPKLQAALDVLKSNAESGGETIGTIRVYGTAGTKNANWIAFSNIYYHPDENDMMHFENIWDDKARGKTCGFFFPQIWCYEPFIEDGNSLFFASWEADSKKKKRAKDKMKSNSYLIYVGQRANKPSEAFTNTRENIFSSPELVTHGHNLDIDNALKFYEDGWYVQDGTQVHFFNKEECIRTGIFKSPEWHDYITDVPHKGNTDVHGCVREYLPPMPNEGDLYIVTYDTYAVDKLNKEITNKHSLADVRVWTRPNWKYPIQGGRLVASWTGRLESVEGADKVAAMMCARYNAKILVEANRGDCIKNFKLWGLRTLLLRDPSEFMERDETKGLSRQFGIIIGDNDKKYEGLQMLYDFLYEVIGNNPDGSMRYRFNTIYDESLVKELLNFDAEGNFDRISGCIVYMFQYRYDKFKVDKLKGQARKDRNDSKHRLIGRLLSK